LGLGRAWLDGGDVGTDDRIEFLADLLGPAEIALGVLLDQPFEQADGKGDAGRLDRLQVDRGEQGMRHFVERALEMSKTPSWRTATTLGPAGVLTRPTRIPAVPSSGRISATGRRPLYVAGASLHKRRAIP